jgi:hypothetical protein
LFLLKAIVDDLARSACLLGRQVQARRSALENRG